MSLAMDSFHAAGSHHVNGISKKKQNKKLQETATELGTK